MNRVTITGNETLSRVEALARYQILDSPEEASFDKLASVAKFSCDAAFAAISFIDQDRQWFKSQIGLNLKELPAAQSFCAHALANPGEVMIVEDASQDPRFSENPLVRGNAHVRFYAGIPIVTADGVAIGAVCVYDQQPRVLNSYQRDGLRCLAQWASTFLERRLTELDAQRCPTCGGPRHATGASLS